MYNSGVSASQRVQQWIGARKLRRLAFDLNGYLFELRLFLNYLEEISVPSSYALLWLALAQVCYRAYPACLLRETLGRRGVVRGLRLKYRMLVALLYYWLELGGRSAYSAENSQKWQIRTYPYLRAVLFALAALDWASAFGAQCWEVRNSKLARFDPLGLLGASGVLCGALFKQGLRAMVGRGPGLDGCWVWEAVLASMAIKALGRVADAFLLVFWTFRGLRRGFEGL